MFYLVKKLATCKTISPAIAEKESIVQRSPAQPCSNASLGNFGDSLVCNMVLIYSPDGINVYGSRGIEIEGIGSA